MALTQSFRKKPFFVTGLLVLGVLVSYLFLPASSEMSSAVQSLFFGVVFLVSVPMLYVRLVLKEPLSSIGLSRSSRRYGSLVVLVAVIPILSIWFLLLRLYGDDLAYALPYSVQSSFVWFLLYELVLVGIVAFVYEVFFRGLVMLSWLSSTGIASVFLQFLVFLVFIGLSGGFAWSNAPIMLAGLASGFVAYYTRSLWYSWVTAWLTLFLSDTLFLVFG